MKNNRFALLLSLALLPVTAQAQTVISQEALFYRCYGQLTQLRPKMSDALLAQVKAGTKTALQACTEILDSAKLTADGGTKIADETNAVAKATLNNLHQMHRSWAREQIIQGIDNRGNMTNLGTQAWYEDSPMGSYITRALFSPSHDVTSVLSGTDFLQPVRTTMNPPKVSGGIPNANPADPADWMFGTSQPFAPRGDLLGIRSVSIAPVKYLPAVAIGTTIPNFENIGTTPLATQSWSTINFLDVTTLSAPIAPVTTQFAIRARGTVQIPTDGQYTFFLDADDIASLLVDGNRVTAGRTTGTAIALTAGAHQFEVQFLQRTTTARLVFSWQGPGIARQVIPASALASVTAEYYTQTQPVPVTFTANEGGGFIGNHNYLMTTFNEPDAAYVPDGQIKTNRSYGRAVIHDTLCRDVPVIRESDAQQFVVANAIAPFRQEAACAACHATLDRLAGGAIRGLRWSLVPEVNQTAPLVDMYGLADVKLVRPSLAADTNWSAVADVDYPNRAPYGHFYFRNYKGELVDTIIKSIPELASAISSQDDYYTCFAKRYYEYFLGIDVPLGDPGDPSFPKLNLAEEHHRLKVVNLGLGLKSHKSLRTLILDILGSDEYKMSDFGIAYGGTANE